MPPTGITTRGWGLITPRASRVPTVAAGAAGGDLPGDQHHEGQPAGRPGRPGMGEDEQQDGADGGELGSGAGRGDGDLAGQVQALPPGDGHGERDQGQ